MSVDRLKDELLSLQLCASGASDPSAARECVANVAQICVHEVSTKDTDYCMSVLFDQGFGIITYLRSVIAKDEFQDSKSEILEMLLALITKHGRAIAPYAVDIKVICLSLFTRDKASKVKNAVIPLLIALLRVCVGSDVCKDLEIKAMIEKFMMELTKPVSKHTPTVKGNLYEILGIFAELFPELMVSYSNRILETYVSSLKVEMTSKTKKAEMSIIAGCLLGLTSLLSNFTHSADEGGKHAYDIYKFTRMALDINIKHGRYDVPRAALQLLTRHACQFGQFLMDEYEKLYEILQFWSSHHNREMLHAGTSAFESFLKQVSSLLVVRAAEGKRNVDIFKFFIQKFREIMRDSSASSKSVSLAIRGYGLLSAPCRVFLSTDDVRFMYTEMMQKSEQIYFSQSTNGFDDRLMNLPSFLEAFSYIVMELHQVNEAFLSSLERLVVLMIENYPRLHHKVHFVCFLAIIRIYFAVSQKGAAHRGFLSRTIYQGLIRTCSHPVLLESAADKMAKAGYNDEPMEVSWSALSYRSYLDFWNALLDVATMQQLSQIGLSLEERDILSKEIYDELLTSVMTMLSQLNLSSMKSLSDDDVSHQAEGEGSSSSLAVADNETVFSSDPVRGLNATKPSDFVIFINLVDFCREILTCKKIGLFRPWVYQLGHELIVHSTRNPLVSGLYKFMTICFQISAKISYFKNLSPSSSDHPMKGTMDSVDDVEMKDASDLDSFDAERRACRDLFSKFTDEVAVQARCYRDELLSSCLIMILALPDEILIHKLKTVTPALQRALVLGRSYLPLARVALDTLQHWCHAVPHNLLQSIYKEVLPLLDAYLKSTEDLGSDLLSVLGKTSSSKSTGKKMALKAKTNAKNKTSGKVEASETELSIVRNQCALLLGRLGGSVNHLLITQSRDQASKALAAWDVEKHLKFDVPFVDLKPTIYFDPFLPRVVELATTSSDRRTKVVACEFLHSVVLFMVGRRAFQIGNEQRHSMAPLFKRIFPVVMQLACDVEQVSHQLFEPLMMQLIHWFTGQKISQSQETLMLLDTIMDGLVDQDDSALRDFSAICLREFLTWTIKQAKPEEIEKSPFSIKAMLKRFCSLARHPNAFKRLGAALGFNNIYSIFRQEESLVDMFTFELLVTFVESLALAHSDDKSLGTKAQCKTVIEHLQRIIKVKSPLLMKSTNLRRKPRNWSNGDLNETLEWLLRQCGRPQTECRHSCMQLVYHLSTSIPDFKMAKDFFSDRMKKNGQNYFIERFEKESYKSFKVKQSDGLGRWKGDVARFSIRSAFHWWEQLLAALDCYTWVFGKSDLLNPQQLFSAGGSGLFEAIKSFVETFAFSSLEDLSRKTEATFTPRETETFNELKCTVIIRLLNFLSVLFGRFGKEIDKIIPRDFWPSVEIWRLVLACVVEPTSVGFNMADVEVMVNLPEQMSELLKSLCRADGPCLSFRKYLDRPQAKGLLNIQYELQSFSQNDSTDLLSRRHFVRSYIDLYAAGFLADVNAAEISSDFIQRVFESIVTKTSTGQYLMKHLSPVETDFAVDCLNLAFALKPNLKQFINLLFDKTLISMSLSSTNSATTPHGELLYTTFKSPISSYLLTVAKECLPLLLSFTVTEQHLVALVINNLLDVVARDPKLRHKYGSDLVSILLGQWNSLCHWWQGKDASDESKSMTLTLLTKLLVINSTATDVNQTVFPEVFSMYCAFLTDRTLFSAVKIRALDLLMSFVVLPEPHLTTLKNALHTFVADNFPMRSSEFAVGSAKYNDYTSALNKILVALELSASPVLLELIISILCRENEHIYEEIIQKTLMKMMKRLRADKQKPLVDVAYRLFICEGMLMNDQRRSALQRVCLPLLRTSHVSCLNEFFSSHVREIFSVLEAKDVKSPESAAEAQLMMQSGCFLLVEVMYSCLYKDDVHSKTSRINGVYSCNRTDVTGKEMTTALTKLANAAKSEDVRGETKQAELRRLLHCAAYNALIAIISRTQTDVKFYNGFLFTENPAKGQILWENLIDLAQQYEFPIEMEAPMLRQQKYAAIRSENLELAKRQQQEQLGGDESDGRPILASVHYLASQYLAESSLNADVSQFDFAGSVMSLSRSSSFPGSQHRPFRSRRGQPTTKDGASNQESSMSDGSDGFVELEMDSLNRHESMAALTALIRHMNHTIKTDKDSKEMPIWMNSLHAKLSSDCHLNIKLFLVKVILNSQETFKPFARFWISPLIQLITGTSLGESGINYLVNDIIVMILSWHDVYKPQADSNERAMANHLLRFLMKHCHNDNRQVLRNNLEVLKTLAEVWRESIDVPSKILYENFSEPDPKSRRNATGVQMVGVIVANGLIPFREGQGIDRDSFYKLLALTLTNEQKIVYAAAAEVIGMTLKLLSETSSSNSDDIKEWLRQYVDNLSSMMLRLVDEKKKLDKFITCVHRIQLNYPAISDRFMAKVLYVLPKVYGVFKANCLEIVRNRIDQIPNVFLELKSKGLVDLLSQRNEMTQVMSLNLVNALLRYLKLTDLVDLIPPLTSCKSSPSSSCRLAMYNIFIWIYDNYRDETGDEGSQLLEKAKEMLLSGLNDENEINRLHVHNFWTHESRLPAGTLNRLTAVLELMYSPETENHYLQYSTNFLLELTSKSPDFNREIFDRPLSECKFQDYKIQSSWQLRHAIMTPLFVETQQSSSQLVSSTLASSVLEGDRSSVVSSRQVRATQDIGSFAPTQASVSRGPYNWLTQSSLDVSGVTMEGGLADEDAFNGSSLLFTIGRIGSIGAGKKLRLKPIAADFGKERLGKRAKQSEEAGGEDGEGSNDILNLRRRFVKNQAEASRVFFAKRQTRLTKQREHLQQEQRQRREHQVTMYRSYRIGDLPDIQIKHSYIIAPLQGLAQRDDVIAELLFNSLFQAIFDEIENEKTEKEADSLIEAINMALNEMLRNTAVFHPPFLSFVLKAALFGHKKLRLQSDLVRQSCTSGRIEPLGILLLEDRIIRSDSEVVEPQTKRPRASSSRPALQNADLWIELARLYKSIGEFDTVHGIFGGKLELSSVTKNAIEAEMRKDYQTAAKLYAQALCKRSEETSDLEADFWEENHLRCLDQLGQWEKLEESCHHLLDVESAADKNRLDVVWENEVFEETFLLPLIRSKLKLLLSSQPQQTFLSFLDRAMKVPERNALLERNYCEELALLYVWQDDYDRANHYATMAMQNFFQDWSSLNELMTFSRLSKLQGLQKLAELQEFLSVVKLDGQTLKLSSTEKLLSEWIERSPDDLLDPPSVWDDVVLNRCVYIDHLAHQLKSVPKSHDAFERGKLSFRLCQLDSAQNQDCFSLALGLLKSTRSEATKWSNDSVGVALYLRWTEAYVKTHHRRIQCLSNIEPSEKLKTLLAAKDLIDKVGVKWAIDPSMVQRQNQLLAETVRLTSDVFSSNWLKNFKDASDDVREMLASIAGCKASAPDEILVSLIEKGYDLSRRATADVKTETPKMEFKSSKTTSEKFDLTGTMQKAHMALFRYCDQYLQEATNEADRVVRNCPSFHQFPSAVVTSLLKAIKLGSHSARVFFPRLLQVVASHQDVLHLFVEHCSQIPCWMFLGWIGQMTAILDKPESPAVHSILLEVAEQYPQALIYPFKLSYEGFKVEGNSPDVKKTRGVIERLKEILSRNHLIERLIIELEQFDQPNIVFKEWVTEFVSLLGRSDVDSKSRLCLYEEMYVRLIGRRGSSAELYDDHSPGSVEVGPYWKNFQKKFASGVEKLCGCNGKNLEKISLKEFCDKARVLSEEMGNDKLASKPPETVKEYSPWLADFQAALFDEEIEIPGQYDGTKKPMPEYHTKISGFQETVRIMTSIRRPKRIVIRGNDEKDYKFLLKCGEDLRQDQRIEILFGLMNDIFGRDATCRQMNLHIRTYQVVPLTTRLGIIEWMDQTVPLKQHIEEMMTDKDRLILAAREDHVRVIGKGSPKDYMTCYKRLSRSDVVTAFRRRENMIPFDLLRRAYLRMSAGPEAFYSLRRNFELTHSLLCVCHYILGIGDRHQSNYMIDLDTGSMVGIDFGHAFGSATQFLPVPELVPFRLTRQILNLMQPMKDKGQMNGVMIHSLRALREHSEILLSTMDVFVKEPSLDWKQNAERQKKQMAGDELSKLELDNSWYPRQKIEVARRKLIGDNCAHIMRSELRLGHGKAFYFKDVESVLMGDPLRDVRAQNPEHNLTVEQQVACLIDLATDPNILGRFWVGWEPWI